MSGWKVFWAGVKGFFTPGTSAFEEIAEVALDAVNTALYKCGAADLIVATCEKVGSGLAVLNKYADWCPDKWRAQYDYLRGVVGEIVAVLSDGRVKLDEVARLANKFRIEYAKWFAD